MTNPAQPGTAVATKPDHLVALFEKGRRYVEALLPPDYSLERLVATVRLEIDKNPKLGECTGASILKSSARILRRNLEIGVNAFLVPFNNKQPDDTYVLECQDITGYQGLCQLMMNTGIVRSIVARVVYEGDFFEYEHGRPTVWKHRPVRDIGKRGKIVGAYCDIALPHGEGVFEFLTLEELEEVRQKFSKQHKKGPMPPWWAKKRAIIYTSKTMPKSPHLQVLRDIAEHEERVEEVVDVSDMQDERAMGAQAAAAISPPDPTGAPPKAPEKAPAFSGRPLTDDELLELDERRLGE